MRVPFTFHLDQLHTMISKFPHRCLLRFCCQLCSLHVYDESHCAFDAPWTLLVALKDPKARENWYRNPAEIELQLQKRILPTRSGGSSLRFFDGATMSSYQVPPSVFQAVHCRQEDTPEDCKRTMRLDNAPGSNETVVKDVYDPFFERHNRDNMAVHKIHGWEDVRLVTV